MPPLKTSAAATTTTPEPWGAGCLAWRLLPGADLAVAEEVMPPGTSEVRHRHARARQFFYVLEGELAMETADGTTRLAAGEGLEMPPGVAHCARNLSSGPVRLLVISAPTTQGDREELP
jgi:mannose-6-phosphate isomerase-like protein (cupin superfamily)